MLLAFFSSGCSVLSSLPPAPNTFAPTIYPDKIKIGVSKVSDSRDNTKAGSIGGLIINVDNKSLSDFTSNYLLHYLNEKMQINVVRIEDIAGNDLPAVAQKYSVERLVVGNVADINMFSLDELLQPTEVGIVIEIVVYDSQGSQLYKRSVVGNFRKRVNSFIIERSTGKLVEEVVKDAMNNLINDADFKKAVVESKH